MLYRAPSYPRRVRDTDLLRSAASGELSCLEALVRGVIDQVFPFAYALTGDYNHAQDLSIEIAARVSGCIRRMSNFDNFDLWIYRLTINGAAESRQGRGKKLSRIRSEGKGRVGIYRKPCSMLWMSCGRPNAKCSFWKSSRDSGFMR
jgi:hypothetical protein